MSSLLISDLACYIATLYIAIFKKISLSDVSPTVMFGHFNSPGKCTVSPENMFVGCFVANINW